MSVFNDLLGLFQLNVSVYHNARICGDWRLNAHDSGATCFHMATQGGCILDVPEHGKWQLNEGDLVIFPNEIAHSMYPIEAQCGEQAHLAISSSQCVAGTSMLCGAVSSVHRSSQFVMSMLPPVLVVSGEKARAWLQPIAQLIVHESLASDDMHNPMLKRLSELLFAYALRCYAENYQHDSGVLALYAHPKLVFAIKAIHAKPAHTWQLASLAKECAMSRTQFSKLFAQISGMTVMQYLTWWRMQLAWAELRRGASVDYTAEVVGYRSSAAFARAFKAEFGATVGAVRKQQSE